MNHVRCVIYVRVSSDEQIAGTSLESQEAICRAFAERQGWQVDSVFRELGESAKSSARPQFQAMVAHATKRSLGIHRVLVYRLDRFARNSHDHAVYQALLAGAGAILVSATEPTKDDPTGRFLQTVLAGIAQLDNDIRAERTVTSMRQLCSQGYWVHQPPFGYRVARLNGKPVLEADPIAGPVIRRVFAEIAAHRMTPAEAVQHLNRSGLKTRRNGAFSIQAVHTMLREPIYAGWIRTKLTDGKTIRAEFSPLVDPAIFDRVQLVLAGRGRGVLSRKTGREEFVLRGLLQCGVCGERLTASWSKGRSSRYGYYHCRHGQCRLRIRKDAAEAAFVDLLQQVAERYRPFWSLLRHQITEVWTSRRTTLNDQRDAVDRELRDTERAAAKLLDKLLDGTITDEIFKARDHQYRLHIALLKTKLHDSELDTYDVEALMSLAQRLLANLSELWAAGSPEWQRRFERALFPGGITWDVKSGLRTAISASIFGKIDPARFDKKNLAPQTFPMSNLVEFLGALKTISQMVAA